MAVTWNPADKYSNITLSGGDLVATNSSGGTGCVRATNSKSAGKWYFEVLIGGVNGGGVGIATVAEYLGYYVGYTAQSYGYHYNAYKVHSSFTAWGATFAVGDIISCAFDLDAGKIWWAKNGTWQASGDPATGANPAFTGLSGTFFPMVHCQNASNSYTANFGATAFAYTPPSGFSGVESYETELVDFRLNLSTVAYDFEDLATWLRAHDGIEYEDLKTLLAAYLQDTEDLPLFMTTLSQAFEDFVTRLEAWAWRTDDLQTFLKTLSLSLDDFKTALNVAGYDLSDLSTFLSTASPTVFSDLMTWLSATDGVARTDFATYLSAISLIPAYRAVTAQRLTSVISEVA